MSPERQFAITGTASFALDVIGGRSSCDVLVKLAGALEDFSMNRRTGNRLQRQVPLARPAAYAQLSALPNPLD